MASFGSYTDSRPFIKNILLLDSEGKRIAVKYYSDDWPSNGAKLAFEKSVFMKTQKTNARSEVEITMLDNNVVVYKFNQDLHFFVTGGDDENELILDAVLNGLYDAVDILLRNKVDKYEALENLDLILLCLDEIVDGGMVLETDANVIAGKVASNSSLDTSAPLSEQVFLTIGDKAYHFSSIAQSIKKKVISQLKLANPLNVQTISQALAMAREHFTRSLLS